MIFYCLVSFSRTGSTALEKVLASHDTIFHDMTRLPLIGDKREWVQTFLENNKVKFKKACGFKCLLYQYDDYLKEDILSNKHFKKIILLRHNIFESSISKKVAEKIGNWHSKVDYKNIQPFEIDLNWFKSYLSKLNETINFWKTNSVNYQVFYYEDLFFSKETYKPVLDFLQINEPTKPYTISKSNNYSTINTIVKNFNQLKDYYEQLRITI